jgi:hypothetical protein
LKKCLNEPRTVVEVSMSNIAKFRQSTPEIRENESLLSAEDESPESAIRAKVHTPDPSLDFYDELTEPLWSPPVLLPETPVDLVTPDSFVEEKLNEEPPHLPLHSAWQMFVLMLRGE